MPVLLFIAATAMADEAARFRQLQEDYDRQVRPLLTQFCLGCHSTEKEEGELDLERFATLAEVRRDPAAWQNVAEMLAAGEMPPEDSPQPSDEQRGQLRAWVASYLDAEALANAGDPGPVILRRLSNDEYNHTVRDLTGIDSLDPTREFPVDGAAGEGFTNSGGAQGMSPSLVQKYLDAAKEVAKHAVLLPDGITFSRHTTQRDQTDELVGRIQAFYRQFTEEGGGTAVNLQGIQFDTNQGGLLPLEPYLAATLAERDALARGDKTPDDVAGQRSLNAKYLAALWQALSSDIPVASDDTASALMGQLRRRWLRATPQDAAKLAADIAEAQKVLWKFNSIGHIGREGRPKVWMEPVTHIVARREYSLKLPASAEDFSIFLIAADAGDGNEHDYVVWENPRLVHEYRPDLPLADLAGLQKRIAEVNHEVLSKTSQYLAAAAEFAARGPDETGPDLDQIATKHRVRVEVLKTWLDYLAIGEGQPVVVTGHLRDKHTSSDYRFVSGWGSPETPSIRGNASDQQVRIPGIARPHSIVAHPSPAQFVAAGWQSPISGLVRVAARLADAHPECGNGQEWFVQHRTSRNVGNLWQGEFATRGSASMTPKTISVRQGELVSFILGPRDGNHGCDLTEINLVITETDGEGRTWDLAGDCSDDMQAGNPHADSYGNAGIWHFYAGEMASVDREDSELVSVPAGSLLAGWQQAKDDARRAELARQVETLATAEPPANRDSPDAVLYDQLHKLMLSPRNLVGLLAGVQADQRFGKHRLAHPMKSSDLVVQAPSVVEFRVPADLAEGSTFLVTGRLDPKHGGQGSVSLEVATSRIAPEALPLSNAVVASDGSPARRRVESSFAEFRGLFPPALCYARIVPVDETVTLTLFYRQDDALQRLMLDDRQKAELDRLWDELFYVSHEPLKYHVAFEQIREFATQDRPDLVKTWAPLVKAVDERAEAFRQRLVDTEAAHLRAVLELADRAWRRKLSDDEARSIRDLYHQLREDELPHDEALRLTIARVFTSPAFLYRRETPAPGETPAAVSDVELASRLSYFLWSSLPDAELRRAAEAHLLRESGELVQHTRRMLDDPRTRRLAVQFACQWLHVRGFDENAEKNEKLYPDFAQLRDDMYEETVRFFEDMFRNDGSILDMLDADHTFVSESLARHYGIDWIPSLEFQVEEQGRGPDSESRATESRATQWRRVDGVRAQGRGGLLAMAAFLASQSGASRTSPILRGNWIYETLLGERLPRPPAGVPQLPDQPPQGLTARQLIEQHSSLAECAKCHARIDPYGFALEQYDAVGRLRPQAADTRARLFGGTTIEGLDGLRGYLLQDRRQDFVRQFCRKLLGYALGREVQLSDRPLLDEMTTRLAENDYRFSVAAETIVLSKQFRMIRGEQRRMTKS